MSRYRDNVIKFWHEQQEQKLPLREALSVFSDANMSDGNSSRSYRMRMVESLVFELAHRVLADQGRCDGTGGVEYHRVREEWYEEGCPPDVEAFIRERSK